LDTPESAARTVGGCPAIGALQMCFSVRFQWMQAEDQTYEVEKTLKRTQLGCF